MDLYVGHLNAGEVDMTKARTIYTWEDATTDLALATSLTLTEASKVTWRMRSTPIHPYDALPLLTTIYGPRSPETVATALADLITLATQPD